MLEYLYIILLLVALVRSRFTNNQETASDIEIGSNRFNRRDDTAFMKRYERMVNKWGQSLK